MAKFTIGIPTYNRAGFLRRAIESALDQTYPDVEVLVSDNASTDETPEIARSFGDRIRYHRNAENIGMWPNFELLTKLATGDNFGWLQDDDLIHRDFTRRAMAAFESNSDVVMYTCFSITGWSSDTFFHPQLFGPPITLDWMGSKSQAMDGSLILPLSFFATFSMPPVTAYRTDAIRRACQGIDLDIALFNERIIQSRAVVDGRIVVDPWPGGLFFRHDHQGHLIAGHGDLAEFSRQWGKLAVSLCRLIEERPDRDWMKILADWIDKITPVDARSMLNDLPPEEYWPQAPPLIREICSEVLGRIPIDFHGRHRKQRVDQPSTMKSIRDLGRRLTPPLLWDAMKRVKLNLSARTS
jgi:glycosyltransferase involved in cell wall biosynthesis